MLNPILKQYHINNRYFDIFNGCDFLVEKKSHIENVLHFTEILLNDLPLCCKIDKELALFCAEHYKDGYVEQYKLFETFGVSKVSYSNLGLERFNKWLYNSTFVAPLNNDIQIFRDVILYYSKPSFCTSALSKQYVTFIGAIDNFVTATCYLNQLENIIKNDLNGYIRNDPRVNQNFVSGLILRYYESGRYNLIPKHCSTYAEYTLYVATFLVDCIKKYPFLKYLISQPGYEYPTIWEGYKHIFENTFNKRMSNKALKVLKNALE